MLAKKWAVAAVAVALVAGACGGDDADATTTTAVVTTTLVTTTTVATTTTATAPPETTTTTTTVPPETTTTLPGELVDFGPRQGAVLAMIGVAPDDVLNVRAAPGIDQEIVAALGPLSNHAVAQGQTRLLPNSAWYEVDVNGVVGWASSRYLAQLGVTTDETAYVLDNAFPRAETMLQMVDEVAALYISTEPASTVTVVDGPRVGDLADVTVDVVGVGDDALVGFRLHIFAQPDEGGEGWEIRTVEVTALCGRGVTEDGLCL